MITSCIFAMLIFTSQSEQLDYTRTIWTYWDGPLTPLIIDLLGQTEDTIKPSWTLQILEPTNLTLFFEDSVLRFYKQLTPQLFSDYLRANLLYKYGGMWMDATSLITSVQFLNNLLDDARDKQAHLIAFGSYPVPRKSLQSGVFYTPKGSVFISAFQHEMETMLRVGVNNYIIRTYRKGVSFPDIVFKDYPSLENYFAVAVLLQMVMDRLIPRNISTILLDTPKYMYALQEDCRWNTECVAASIRNRDLMNKYPITKLNSVHRVYLEPQFRKYIPPLSDTEALKYGIDLSCWQQTKSLFYTSYYIWLILLLVFSRYPVCLDLSTKKC